MRGSIGNPAAAVAWLANKLFAFGIELKEGTSLWQEP